MVEVGQNNTSGVRACKIRSQEEKAKTKQRVDILNLTPVAPIPQQPTCTLKIQTVKSSWFGYLPVQSNFHPTVTIGSIPKSRFVCPRRKVGWVSMKKEEQSLHGERSSKTPSV